MSQREAATLPPGAGLPPVRSAQNPIARAGAAAARIGSTGLSESRSSHQPAPTAPESDPDAWGSIAEAPVEDRAPAPLRHVTGNVAESLARRVNDEVSEPTLEGQKMTLADLALLVEKQKRGVKSVVASDISVAADWSPGEEKPMVIKSSSGADLARRMLKGAR